MTKLRQKGCHTTSSGFPKGDRIRVGVSSPSSELALRHVTPTTTPRIDLRPVPRSSSSRSLKMGYDDQSQSQNVPSRPLNTPPTYTEALQVRSAITSIGVIQGRANIGVHYTGSYVKAGWRGGFHHSEQPRCYDCHSRGTTDINGCCWRAT